MRAHTELPNDVRCAAPRPTCPRRAISSAATTFAFIYHPPAAAVRLRTTSILTRYNAIAVRTSAPKCPSADDRSRSSPEWTPPPPPPPRVRNRSRRVGESELRSCWADGASYARRCRAYVVGRQSGPDQAGRWDGRQSPACVRDCDSTRFGVRVGILFHERFEPRIKHTHTHTRRTNFRCRQLIAVELKSTHRLGDKNKISTRLLCGPHLK